MTTYFGQPKSSWRPLQKMFLDIPAKYDLMNRILTLRLDEQWRKMAARECVVDHPKRILDLCTGTGDLALHISRMTSVSAEIFALDFSPPMLEIARRKSQKHSIDHIRFLEGDAAVLPFEDSTLDVIGIAFAFRNLTYKNPDHEKFLREIVRILNDNGKFVIVETSQPESKILRYLFHFYLHVFVTGLGGRISGHKTAYRYLAASATHFYSYPELKKLLLSSGFKTVSYRPLLGGIAGITIARKI